MKSVVKKIINLLIKIKLIIDVKKKNLYKKKQQVKRKLIK